MTDNFVKIWHDDVRPAPDGWLRARTNAEAMDLLREHGDSVIHISLDHDLGSPNEGDIYARGMGEETGVDLVLSMVAENLCPPSVSIHSWNPAGAKTMADILRDNNVIVDVSPFKVGGH